MGLDEEFLVVLDGLDGHSTNQRLKDALEWGDETYLEIRAKLIDQGLVVVGKGRGGTVSLAEVAKKRWAARIEAARGYLGAESSFNSGGRAQDPHAVSSLPERAPSAPSGRVKREKTAKTKDKGGDLGFEAELFKAADKLRGNLEPSEYKHVALGLIFLKYISEAFEAQYERLQAEEYADPEDPEEYLAANVFWVPPEARWSNLQANAKRPEIEFFDVATKQTKKGDIGGLIDNAMEAIEQANINVLRDVLPKNYARPQLDRTMLGELIDLFSNIDLMHKHGEARDLLGRVYEYFISEFAGAEGKRGGEFFTPRSVVKTLVAMLEPTKGRVYDPCCGSGGMFVQAEDFVVAHANTRNVDEAKRQIAIYGQERNHTTWRLCKMNLAVRGIDADIKWNNEGSFLRDEFPQLKFDYVMANPPFNISDWWQGSLDGDARWTHGTPPQGNANFAWLQHILHHLAPRGTAGVVLANGSMSSQQSGEGEIRKAMIEADVVDCMIALPGQLFYSTQIPACLWFLARDKSANGHRDRRGEILFIDARKMGHMVDRTRRELSEADIQTIADTYHRWRGRPEMVASLGLEPYADQPGFCRSSMIAEVREFNFVLNPGRYVGASEEEDDGVDFAQKIATLRAKLSAHFQESRQIDAQITVVLGKIEA